MEANFYQILVVFLTILIAFFYETSGVFRYYVRFGLYYGIVMFESVFMIPIYCLRAKNVCNLM